MRHVSFAAAGLAMWLASIPAGAATVGSPAPAIEPNEWLNTKGTMTWKDLKGRLVIVEKWATW